MFFSLSFDHPKCKVYWENESFRISSLLITQEPGRIHIEESFIPSRFVRIDYRILNWVVLLFLFASTAEPIELLLLLQCSVHGSWHDGNDDNSREWETVKLATPLVTRSLYNFTQIIGMKASERRKEKKNSSRNWTNRCCELCVCLSCST